MSQQITETFLQVVAGDIEKLLLENAENIDFAYRKIPDGIKLSLGISLDPSSGGIVVNYDLGFDLEPKPEPPAKHKVKLRHVIDEGQANLEFIGQEIRAGRMTITSPPSEVAERGAAIIRLEKNRHAPLVKT